MFGIDCISSELLNCCIIFYPRWSRFQLSDSKCSGNLFWWWYFITSDSYHCGWWYCWDGRRIFCSNLFHESSSCSPGEYGECFNHRWWWWERERVLIEKHLQLLLLSPSHSCWIWLWGCFLLYFWVSWYSWGGCGQVWYLLPPSLREPIHHERLSYLTSRLHSN